ncbi:MAG: hypothetical protein JOZ72_14360 [Alphaproteobacteria bacterium]|nr:hypothetical protein [Alphaproteobacteria bacterium]
MRYIAFALLLGLSVGAAAASDEHWIVIKSVDGAYGYDQGSVVDKGEGHFTFSSGLYTPKPVTAAGVTYSYMLTDSELSCSDGAYTTSAFYLFDDNAKMLDMKEGNGHWDSTGNNGVLDILAGMICSHEPVKGAVEAGDMEQAMKTMRGYFK